MESGTPPVKAEQAASPSEVASTEQPAPAPPANQPEPPGAGAGGEAGDSPPRPDAAAVEPPAGDLQSKIRESDVERGETVSASEDGQEVSPQEATVREDKAGESSELPAPMVEARAEQAEAAPQSKREEDAASSPVMGKSEQQARAAPETGSSPNGIADREAPKNHFPSSSIIDSQKSFWIKIFTQYNSNQGLIHDKSLTLPIYEAVNLEDRSRRAQKRYLKKRKRAVAQQLRSLAKELKSGETLTEQARRLLKLLPEGINPKKVRELARNVRFQRGLADRFREGLIRSGAILAEMRTIMARHRVPEDLVYLPHVESSFNLRTHSKFGAAGIWQFTRGTGRKFLTIKYEVDERLDPILSTEAAARFLRQNYDRLKSWPLAITGYNHGPQGIERIISRKGTRDLSTIIQICGCRLFKFASKNFYAEFLAAREVATNAEAYFGALEYEPVLDYHEIGLPFFLEFGKALQILKLNEENFLKLNPSLRTPVIVGAKYIPKGHRLRLPYNFDPVKFLNLVPHEHRWQKQKLTEVVRVRRGDTLYDMGRRYKVPWQVIARANNITAYRRIRPGQRLVIPRRDKVARRWVAKAVVKPKAKPPRKVVAPEPLRKVDTAALAARMEVAKIAFQRAEGAYQFQDLDVYGYDAESRAGWIKVAYGETVGHYAEWAGVSARTLRRYNRRRNVSPLRHGGRVVIPFSRVSLQQFNLSRFEYHQSREQDFYSTYAVTDVTKVKVRRGDTVWFIAQSNDVPMWLFYQQNPALVKAPVRAGMTVDLPVIVEVSELGSPQPGQEYNLIQ
ncbi:MAG: LysM peptidoglycan-binding domain-containing protein [SAR324 cluster bacterium]|nr:LysM peptidoglycan-binding domain-containing protein [SAR324 cluster bacterium]